MAEKAPSQVPAGMHTMTPQLFFNGDCKEAIEFYKKAFNAQVQGQVVPSPDGKTVWHAMLKIGDSNFMVNDTMPESYEHGPKGSSTTGIWLYVEDSDKWFTRAVEAGAEVLMPMTDMFWGDRTGKLKDPFGHTWDIASHMWDYTEKEMEKEMQEKQEEMKSTMKQTA